jgi:DinB superfamily
MDKTALEPLRFPIGRFKIQENISEETINQCIRDIETLPKLLRLSVEKLNDVQLDTPYRPEGWTLRQVVHHVADSHINSFVRFKWALTEDAPTIKVYDEKKWAEVEEAKTAPVKVSLDLLESLHKRWIILLKNLSKEDLKKTFIHPVSGFAYTLAMAITLYAWHGKHHIGHIESLKESNNW